MKNIPLMIIGIALVGVVLVSAQPTDAMRASTQRMQEIAAFAETSTIAKQQGDKIAAAADYLKMALVLGLGMLIGRMSAVSHRELKDLKVVLARLANHSTTAASEIKTLETCRQNERKI